MKSTENDPSAPSPSELRRLADTELSLKSRIGYVALLLVSLIMVAAIASLWATEPSLPLRTHIVFGALVVIGFAWAMFAVRVLATRRVLLARHRIVAGRMAVAFTGLYLLGSLVAAWVAPGPAAVASTSVATIMVALAIALHARAQNNYAKLEKRRKELARQLSRQ